MARGADIKVISCWAKSVERYAETIIEEAKAIRFTLTKARKEGRNIVDC